MSLINSHADVSSEASGLNFGLGFYNISTFIRYVCGLQRHTRVSAYEDIAYMSI